MQTKPNHQNILRLKDEGTYSFLYMCMANHYRHWKAVVKAQTMPFAATSIKPRHKKVDKLIVAFVVFLFFMVLLLVKSAAKSQAKLIIQ